MRAVRVLAAVLVTAGVAGLGAAAPAFAGTASAAGIPTSITLASTYPQYYGPSFTERSVTLVGALVNAQNGADADIMGEPVTITEQIAGSGPWKTVATTTTSPTAGSTDNLDVTLNNLTAGGIFKAEFAGDSSAGYTAATSSPVNVETDESTVTINWGYSPSLPIRPGTTETFTGTAYVNDNGVHLPVPGAIVTLHNGYNPTKVRTTTAKNGSFKLAVKPTATANWTAEVTSVAPWPYNLYAGSSVAVRVLVAPNVYRTRVVGLTLPARQEVHTPLRISGTVQALRGSAWKPLGSVVVGLYYRILPKGKWTYAGSATTVNYFGTFTWREGMWAIGDLAWQARVEPTVIGASGYANSSATHDGILVDRTYLQVSAGSWTGQTDMNALVLDHTQNSPPYMYIANVTGAVKFYNRAKGSTTWRYLGSARVQGNGDVAFSMKATLNGNYKAVFLAQGYFLSSSAIAPS